MKALVLEAYHHLEYKEVPVPLVGQEDVLIEVKACGICGSDVHGLDGSSGRRIPPLIMGHEAAGVIVQVGAAVEEYLVGDRVTFDSTIFCGRCFYCQCGQINLCEQRRVLGVSCAEYRQDGAFAEYVAVPQHILYRLPDAMSYTQAAMVELLSIALHALQRTPVNLNDSAVVIGAGMVGLLVIQALKAAGCRWVGAVDLAPARLELAQQLGADAAYNSEVVNVVEEVRAAIGPRGADIGVDAVGLATTLSSAVEVVRKGGAVTMVGNLAGTASLPLQAAVTRELTLYGSCASAGEYPACLNMIANNTINVDALITAVAPLSEGVVWMERLYSGSPDLLKVILEP